MKATSRFILVHLKKDWIVVAALLVFINIKIFLETIAPVFLKQLVDTATADPTNIAGMTSIIFYIIAVNIGGSISRTVFDFLLIFLEPRVMKRMVDESHRYMLRHSYSFFSNNFAGALVKRVTRLSSGFEEIFDRLVFELYPTILKVVITLYLVYSVSSSLAAVLLVYIVVFVGYNLVLTHFKVKLDNKKNAEDSAMVGLLADNITNFFNITLFSAHEREQKRFEAASETFMKAQFKSYGFGAAGDVFLRIISIIVEFVLVSQSVAAISRGELTIGDFVLVQSLLIALYSSLWSVSWVIRNIGRGFSNAKEMIDILEMPHEITDVEGANELKADRGEIIFENLTFAHNGNGTLFKNFNLTLAPGKRVALVSHSGGGKTTLTNLLMRLWDIPDNCIFIDGQDIKHMSIDSVRRNIALVPQSPDLFHRSLFENIAYGKPDATLEEVIDAAKRARCHEFISQLEHGYDTLVGERGVKLSGGQRQRIAIARILLLGHAPILILDEATSALDSETEHMIQEALHEVMMGRTVIAIAHRLSTITSMDEIIVLEKGEVIERGSHEELIAGEGGLYKHLWGMQSGGYVEF